MWLIRVQPLLYQVATGLLSPEHIAAPLRHVLRKQANTTVIQALVTGVDAAQKLCFVEGAPSGSPVLRLPRAGHRRAAQLLRPR